MSLVIDLYKVRFFKKRLFNGYIKTMDSLNHTLDQFITDMTTSEDVKNFFLPVIDMVISGQSVNKVVISETLIALKISKIETSFYSDSNDLDTGIPIFRMPTKDLKEIAEAWMEYLLQD